MSAQFINWPSFLTGVSVMEATVGHGGFIDVRLILFNAWAFFIAPHEMRVRVVVIDENRGRDVHRIGTRIVVTTGFYSPAPLKGRREIRTY